MRLGVILCYCCPLIDSGVYLIVRHLQYLNYTAVDGAKWKILDHLMYKQLSPYLPGADDSE